MTIAAILFDFGGTLDHDGGHWFDRMHQVIRRQGHDLPFDLFYDHADAAARYIAKQPDTRTFTMEQTVQTLLNQVRSRITHAGMNGNSQFDPIAVMHEFAQEAYTFLRRNNDILAQLNAKYRLGCISNNWGNTAGWCAQFQLDRWFETIIDSTVVGASKPDRRIFDAATDALKLTPAQCVYVGDHYDCDMIGAHQVGMTTVWINDGSKNCPDLSCVTHQVQSLTELPSLQF